MSIFKTENVRMAEFACSYKLLVSDLDGTLLDGRHQIPKRTLNLIRKFKAMGGNFTIATGRNEVSVMPYIRLLGVDVPYIIYNGAKIVSDNGILFEKKLPAEHAYKSIEFLRNCRCDILLYSDNMVYIERLSENIIQHLDKDGNQAKLVDDLQSVINTDPYKILVISEDSKVGDYIGTSIQKLENPPVLVRSEETYYEILPAGVSKGAALKQLAQELNIPLSEIISFGDNLNDLEMLNVSGLGVAVRNANPILLENADYITASNEEEGVAQVLEMLIKGDFGKIFGLQV